MTTKDDTASWRPSVPVSLAFAAFVLWTSSSLILVDQPDYYGQTLPICLSFVAGVLATCLILTRRGRHLPCRTTALLCAIATLCNAAAVLVPLEPVTTAGLAVGSFSSGCVALHWAHHLVTVEKGQIIPTVALGELACSVVLLAGMAGPACFPVLVITAPLPCAVCVLVAHRDGHAADPHASARPVRDKHHTVWPLPCAMLVCSALSSVFVSMLSSPFVMTSASVYLYEALFGTVFSLALLIWTFVVKRRNLNAFILVIVAVLELSLLVFATGAGNVFVAPMNAIAACVYALTFLVWILAAFLSRSPYTGMPYQDVFALFLICGNGALGHALGFLIVQQVRVPFLFMKDAAAVLLVLFALLLVALFMAEVTVLKSRMERESALQLAVVSTQAEQRVHRVEEAAARQVSQARSEAEQRVAQIQREADEHRELSRRECCERIIERDGLTAREGEALMLLAEGKTRADIAAEWVVSENTVKYHLRNVYRKLDVHNSRELMAYIDATRG